MSESVRCSHCGETPDGDHYCQAVATYDDVARRRRHLTQRLRDASWYSTHYIDIRVEAADAIEALEAELAAERALADRAAVILEALDREPKVWLRDYADARRKEADE